MKIAIAQIECSPGQPYLNFINVKKHIVKALDEKADMVIFPENIIPGYLIGDQLEETAFIEDCMAFNEDIRKLSTGIYVVFGSIVADLSSNYTDGRYVIYNSVFVTHNNSFINMKPGVNFHAKALLPNYREFEEPRHIKSGIEAPFYSGPEYFTPVEIEGIKIGFTICECGWDEHYPIKPVSEYVKRGAELIINISCSPFTENKNVARDRVFGLGHAKTHKIPLIYVNCVGIQNNGKTIYTFDGSSVAYNKQGARVFQAPMFEEGLYFVNYENGDLNIDSDSVVIPTGIGELAEAMKYGAKKFLERCGTNKVVIGASGGIDSAVAAVIFEQAVGPENLLLVNMPSKYNSDTTKNAAKKLAENIGCYYTVIPIEDSCALTVAQVDQRLIERTVPAGFTTKTYRKILKLSQRDMENVQARDRSSRILAAVASAWGGVFTCNGNKAEFTVGYTTFYGDLGGFFAPLGDLWKHQVYELAQYLNRTYAPLIPQAIIDLVPSAELSDEQDVDKGKGDPLVYWYHDQLFASWEQRWFRVTPEENLKWYLDGTINTELGVSKDIYKLFPTAVEFIDDLERWYACFKGLSVAKRVQSPPILGLTRRSYGFDYRDYLGKPYYTRNYLEMRKKALCKSE